jgi:hypothetical protein
VLDQQHEELQLEINNARETVSDRFIAYESQFRAADLACRIHGTPISALMLERHQYHTSSIHARKLALAENALAAAQKKMARFQLQLTNEALTGSHNTPIAHATHTCACYCTCGTLRHTRANTQ